MLIIPPRGVSGNAILVTTIVSMARERDTGFYLVGSNRNHNYWGDYPKCYDMEVEFRRICNEVNSLLSKPTIQL
jgi:hypothetical protein